MAIPWILQKPRTDQEIVDETNDLARIILAQAGYQVPDGHCFYEDPNPRSKQAWQRACEIMEHMTATEPNDALANLDTVPPGESLAASLNMLERLIGTDHPKGRQEMRDIVKRIGRDTADVVSALAALLPEIDSEIEQRQTSGNDEYWQGLKALSDAGHAALAKAGGNPIAKASAAVKVKPRLTAKAIEAACKAHFGTDNADGVCVTVKDRDWTFREAFTRMWNGAWSALTTEPAAPDTKPAEEYHPAPELIPNSDAVRQEAKAVAGWIVGNGTGLRWRCWKDGMPDWTNDRSQATRYACRVDAEEACREDEDAWIVVRYPVGNPIAQALVQGKQLGKLLDEMKEEDLRCRLADVGIPLADPKRTD